MIRTKIISRYLFKELLGPFFLGLLVFTFILLMDKVLDLMDMVINKGIGLNEVLSLLFYLLPSLLVMTIPMSITLGILIALGKLSSDAEIIAMKASGISLYQLLPPFAVLCLACFLITGSFTLYLLPKGNRAFRDHIIDVARKHSAAQLEEGIFNDGIEDMVIYVREFDRAAQQINGIMISDRRKASKPSVIVAKHGIILSDQNNLRILFKLYDGSIHRQAASGGYEYARFSTYEMKIPFKELGGGDHKELKHRERSLPELVAQVREREDRGESSIRVRVEIQKRFAFPFACLVFGLLGVSLGVFWRRGGRAYGFVLSIAIVFFYYFLLSVGENMAKSGFVYPFMGIWLPNVLLGGLGLYLFRKTVREEPLPLTGLVSKGIAPRLGMVVAGIIKKFNPTGKSS